MQNKTIFEETQRFTKNPLIWFLIGTMIFVIVLFTIVGETKVEKSNDFYIALGGISALFFCIIILFYFLKLRIKVFNNHVEYTLIPFPKNILRKEDIYSVENVKYKPLLEWGGWGIRIKGRNRAYNVYGNKGVKMTLKDGRIILLGSQKSQLLYEAILKK